MNNVEIMAVLFAIVIVGFVAGRLGYMGGDFDRRLSGLIIDFTCPALILSSTMTGTLPDRRLILPLLAISVLTYVLLTAAALWLPPLLTRRREDRGVVGFSLMFGNVGFIGYPVVAAIFGQQAVFYAAVLNVVNTFAVFTVGTMLLAGRGAGTPHSRREWVRLLVSSPMVAAYLSMVIVAFGIDNIPVVISQPLTYIGNITVPAALLIIGSSLSQLPLHTMLGNRTVYVTAIFRLALLPLAVYAVTTVLGFSHLVVSINTVVIAMPVATYGTILCLKLGRDTALITELTFITTLIAVCSIPVVAMMV